MIGVPDGPAAAAGDPHRPGELGGGTRPDDLAAGLIRRLRELSLTIGTAESLTGGLVAASLTSVPGASAVVRGGIVAYTHDVKAHLLGVDAGLLGTVGAVDPEVALAMAEGICGVLPCDVGLGTTGVAGPDPSDGKPVGTVYVAAWVRRGRAAHREVGSLALGGDRAAIRAATVHAVLSLADRTLAG